MPDIRHSCSEENANKFADWIKTRGGIAVWSSVNLSNPGMSWSTPATTEEGEPFARPTWETSDKPSAIITDPNDIDVHEDKEVKRFYIAVRSGANGLQIKLSDGATRKVNAAVEKAGKGAYHVFDYDTQEAVIMAPDKTYTLQEWMELNGQ